MSIPRVFLDAEWPDDDASTATEAGTEVAYYEDCAELAKLRIWARRCIIPCCRERLVPGALTCGDDACMVELGMWPDTLRGYLTEYRAQHPGIRDQREVTLREARDDTLLVTLAVFAVAIVLGFAMGLWLRG